MRKNAPRLIAFPLAVMVMTASALAQEANSVAAPDFAKDIAPIFTKYCTGCHNDSDREGKLSLESYDSVLKGGAKGGIVTPAEPDLSRLIRVITGEAEPKMPPDDEEGPNPTELATLKAWIAAGAKGPSGAPTKPMLVTPAIKLLAPAKPAINSITLSPDGKLLAIARHGEVELQTLPEQKVLHRLQGIPGSVNGVAFSADGALLAVAAGEPGLYGEARVYRVDDGTVAQTFRGHRDSLYTAALSPDGTLLATGGYDNTIKLWDVASGRDLRTLDAHNGAVFEVAFRPVGNAFRGVPDSDALRGAPESGAPRGVPLVLASVSGDRTVKLWNVATGERLDTLKESTQELYALAISPDGSRLAAAGVDNRIRLWTLTPDAREGTNLLAETKFAHEMPVLRLAWSADGRTIASAGEDRLVKIWNADTLTIRQTLEPQSDWASGLALGPQGDLLVVGRIDGTLGTYALETPATEGEQPLVPLAEVPPEVDYGPQPAIGELAKVAEAEPNDQPHEATPLAAPGIASGTLNAAGSADADLFRFEAQAGDQWILETKAAQNKSPADTKIEVLDGEGNPVPRLLLRAVRDTVIEFRGMNSEQRGVRLAHWEEMLLNEYVYLSGEVIKHYQQRRGPDADAQFYPENGNRIAFFDTTPRAHALDEPGYIVVPYAIGTELPNNGLPVFTLYYENDDDAQRKLGKDSRLTFVAPADGTYLVRVSDVRGFGGDGFNYELIVRRPVPDFSVTVSGKDPSVNAGSGKAFTVKADRIDNFNGPIRVDIEGLPLGFQVTTPLVIPEGLYEAQGAINALADASPPSEEQWKSVKVTATATVCGQERTKELGDLGTIKLADKPKVVVHLELDTEEASQPVDSSDAADETASALAFPNPPEISIAPGGTVTARLRVERNGFEDRIAFDVANLPHGVIVDDIGLSGVLIPRSKPSGRSSSAPSPGSLSNPAPSLPPLKWRETRSRYR
jgi:WD40 repeat protein